MLLVGCSGNGGIVTLGDELPVDPAEPYNAVGMINDGCTAFLIDADHIVAAAHCFVNTETGQWHQRGPLPAGVMSTELRLRFYPNYHPDRRVDDAARVPRADITAEEWNAMAEEKAAAAKPAGSAPAATKKKTTKKKTTKKKTTKKKA